MITDLVPKNKPHDLNQSVVVVFRAGAAPISSSWYCDGNADGVLDTLTVRFKRKVNPSEIKALTIQWNLQQYAISPGTMIKVNDSTYGIPIAGTVTQPTKIVTYGAMDISVEYVAIPKVLRSSPVADSAAPVIVTARLFPGVATADGVTPDDTLEVKFSEAVTVQSTRPFLLSAKTGGVRYVFPVASTGTSGPAETRRFIIGAIEPAGAVKYPMAGDTLWLDPVAAVSDGGGAAQTNQFNRRVLLEVTWPKSPWIVGVSLNTFTPNTGTVITAQKKTPYDMDRTGAAVTIYDAMGNLVVEDAMKQAEGTYIYKWKGMNRNMRLVGTGAYLAIVKISEDGRQIYVKKMKIGVRR